VETRNSNDHAVDTGSKKQRRIPSTRAIGGTAKGAETAQVTWRVPLQPVRLHWHSQVCLLVGHAFTER